MAIDVVELSSFVADIDLFATYGRSAIPSFYRNADEEELSTFDTESAARAVLLCLHLSPQSCGAEFRIVDSDAPVKHVRVEPKVVKAAKAKK